MPSFSEALVCMQQMALCVIEQIRILKAYILLLNLLYVDNKSVNRRRDFVRIGDDYILNVYLRCTVMDKMLYTQKNK